MDVAGSDRSRRSEEEAGMSNKRGLTLLSACVILAGVTLAFLQGAARHDDDEGAHSPGLAQVVALDECDPTSFNAVLGEGGGGFCHNVALSVLGYATTLP